MSAENSQSAKKALRNQILKKLNSLSFHDLIKKSQGFNDHFTKNFFQPCQASLQGRYAVSFCPLSTEPQISLEMYNFKIGYVRILNWENGLMDAAEARRDVPGQWTDISPQPGLQVFQPAESQPALTSDQIGMILVPGLAFDRNGKRLGRGKGFYDRYLKSIPDVLRVGVIFHEQLVTQILADPWDQDVDVILTDQEWIETERFRSWKKHGTIKR